MRNLRLMVHGANFNKEAQFRGRTRLTGWWQRPAPVQQLRFGAVCSLAWQALPLVEKGRNFFAEVITTVVSQFPLHTHHLQSLFWGVVFAMPAGPLIFYLLVDTSSGQYLPFPSGPGYCRRLRHLRSLVKTTVYINLLNVPSSHTSVVAQSGGNHVYQPGGSPYIPT